MIRQLCLLALAGSLGTLARYALAGVVQRLAGGRFPWGTLSVNAIGCFLFGLVWMLAEQRMLVGPQARLVVLTGFLGAFTTFSAFAAETDALLRESQWMLALGNVAANNLLGLLCVMLGLALARLL